MALRKIVLPLDTSYTKHFKIDTYGFYVTSIPPGLEAYLILNNDASQQIALEAQSKIPSTNVIKEFSFINVKPIADKVLTIFYAESLQDFDYIPQTTSASLEGSVEELITKDFATDLTLSSVNTKLEELNNTILPIDPKITEMIDKLDTISSKLDTLHNNISTMISIMQNSNIYLLDIKNNTAP